jgi:hypothetical protein
MVKDPWVEQLLRRPDVRARVQIFIRLVEVSSLAALAAGILLLVVYCAAGM